MTYFILICAVIGAVSLITFIMYGADKRAAIKGRWRVPERTLLALSFFGGAAGGTLAMLLFRHKIKKSAFIFINFTIFLLNLQLISFIIFFLSYFYEL